MKYISPRLLKEPESFLDGMSLKEEQKQRHEGVSFIRNLCASLDFPYYTESTAIIYLHHFLTFHSLRKYPIIDVSIACVLTASKTEETYRKLKHILAAGLHLKHPHTHISVIQIDEYRSKIISYEQTLLETISFDFYLVHPHEFLIKFFKLTFQPHHKSILHSSWRILGNMYNTSLCIQYPPGHLALGSIVFGLEHVSGLERSIYSLLTWIKHTHSLLYTQLKTHHIYLDELEDMDKQLQRIRTNS